MQEIQRCVISCSTFEMHRASDNHCSQPKWASRTYLNFFPRCKSKHMAACAPCGLSSSLQQYLDKVWVCK